MKDLLKLFGVVILGGVIGVSVALYFAPKIQVVNSFGTTSGTGGTQRIAEFSFNPTVGTATSSSTLNTDSQDRIVTGVNIYCSGVGTSKVAYSGSGLAALSFSVSTTSTSAPIAVTNTNYIFSDTIATATPEIYNASTTVSLPTAANSFYRRWASGSYETVVSNSTNTAACIVNVNYLQGLGV